MPNRAGTFVRQQSGPDGYSAFIPAPLPIVGEVTGKKRDRLYLYTKQLRILEGN